MTSSNVRALSFGFAVSAFGFGVQNGQFRIHLNEASDRFSFRNGASGSEIMTLMNCAGGQNRLEFMRWNGTGFVNAQELEPNVSGPAGAEVFMVPDEPPIQVPRLIQAWAESAPS